MEKIAYGILLVVLIAFIILIVFELVQVFPAGILGILTIIAFGLLFIQVFKERQEKKKDDRYSRDVEK